MSNSPLQTAGDGAGTPVVVGVFSAGSVSIALNYGAPTLAGKLTVNGSGMALVLYNQFALYAPLPSAPAVPGGPLVTNASLGLLSNGLYALTTPPPAGWIEPNSQGFAIQPGLNPDDPSVQVASFTWLQTMINANYIIMKGWADSANAIAAGMATYMHGTLGYP